jgi:predicted small secreted protein
MKKFTYLFIALFSLSLLTTSCREEKSTGDKIEEAVEDAGDAIEDAADDVEDEVEDIADDNK